MDGNAFRVVLQAALATIALAVLSVPLNALSRQYMLDALEDHANRIYELAERVHEDFRDQEADRAGGGDGDDDVDEVVGSDRSSEEDTAESGNEGNDEGESNSTIQSVTVVESENPTRDDANVNGEPQAEPAAMRVNCFLFENYDDPNDEGDKESQADIVVKQESPACEMADLMNLGADNGKGYEDVNAVIEVGTIVEEQLGAGSAVETRTTTGAEQSQLSNPKRKRAAVDNSSDSNAGKLSP
jgi:hypothetical protein